VVPKVHAIGRRLGHSISPSSASPTTSVTASRRRIRDKFLFLPAVSDFALIYKDFQKLGFSKSELSSAHPVPPEGRIMIVTARWRGLRWTLLVSGARKRAGRNADSVRRSRVVLAPRSWRYAGGNFPAGNGGKKGRFPGESTYKL
jgi:hypothetical protein